MSHNCQYYPGARECGKNLEEYKRFCDDLIDIRNDFDLKITEQDLVQGAAEPNDEARQIRIFSVTPSLTFSRYRIPEMTLSPVGSTLPQGVEIGWYTNKTSCWMKYTVKISPYWFALYRHLEVLNLNRPLAIRWTRPRAVGPHVQRIPLIYVSFSNYDKAEIEIQIPDEVLHDIDIESEPRGNIFHPKRVIYILNGLNKMFESSLKHDAVTRESFSRFCDKDPDRVDLSRLIPLIPYIRR